LKNHYRERKREEINKPKPSDYPIVGTNFALQPDFVTTINSLIAVKAVMVTPH
jgi:hypothetical protein